MSPEKRDSYIPPESYVLHLPENGIICDSPSPGTNENVSIEDWNDLVNNE